MNNPFPFPLPPHLIARIPSPASDGNAYADVCVDGCWEGVLVINSDGQCVGVYVHRAIVHSPLPFLPTEIEGLRPASIWNRFLAQVPAGVDLYTVSVVTIWTVCPILLIIQLTLSAWLLPLLASVVIFCHIGMYSVRGFPLTRFPTSLAGLAMLVAGVVGYSL